MRSIIVLGMHRSGTSAITRAIGLLGAEMGPPDHLGRHWENRYLRRTNQRLLSVADGLWDSPPELPDGWTERPEVIAAVERARGLVAREFGDAHTVVWKDPRTCLTLPFWRRVFDETPIIVLIYRHPVEVAESLTTRNGLVPGHAMAMWERYNSDALKFTVGLPGVVVEFGSILTDPVERMAELADQLRSFGAHLPHDARTTDLALVPDNRHHEATNVNDLDDPVVTESQREIFRLMGQLAGPHQSLEIPGPVPPPHPLSGQVLALARIRQRGAEVAAQSAARISTKRPDPAPMW